MRTIEIKKNIITIEGTIGVPEEWQFEDAEKRVATYEAFRAKLAEIENMNYPEIEVHIRSTGGDVNDALLIYMALGSLTNTQITTKCWGYIASAATVIAQAASEGCRLISPNSLYLIHACTCAAEGNSKDLLERARLLENTDERLLRLYMERAGLDDDTIFRDLMFANDSNGRWLNSEETILYGLADGLIDASPKKDEPQKKSLIELIKEAIGCSKCKYATEQ